ncbi:2Fe-2S iron-sulfur cluster-binding protein [Arthrobacter mangrovi]|uniref:(2Fe-2S) ferredoxin n=1 Tax=Arthrobacter mangrovi TaxID=2966350 RepID=A0ABQ5MWF3_9MICC|nr:(2Fe-2S)-binding protein [Arthrobacter mangrovi]GLB68307.1 (2Fe-2S) ferredoxin [Arthrobacter mangrovi]
MPKIILRSPDGNTHTVDARVGASVMETAVKHGVPGIVAECGGALSCATCHVYVSDSCLERAGAAEDFEDEMLDDATSERRPNSRLSCQIRMSDELDGLEVEIAPEQ